MPKTQRRHASRHFLMNQLPTASGCGFHADNKMHHAANVNVNRLYLFILPQVTVCLYSEKALLSSTLRVFLFCPNPIKSLIFNSSSHTAFINIITVNQGLLSCFPERQCSQVCSQLLTKMITQQRRHAPLHNRECR